MRKRPSDQEYQWKLNHLAPAQFAVAIFGIRWIRENRILLNDSDQTDNRKRCYQRAKEVFWNNPEYPSPTPAIHRSFPTDKTVKE